MYVALVRLQTPYPISVFVPLVTLSAPAYPLPPPTTLLGALAYVVFREDVDETGPKSPAAKLLHVVTYTAAGATAYFPTRQAERVLQAPYLEARYRKNPAMLYSVGVRWSYIYHDLKLLYVAKDREALERLWGLVRLGRKEGIVAVEDVKIAELKEASTATSRHHYVETYFYAPTRLAQFCEESEKFTMPTLDERNFASTTTPIAEEFWIPKGLGEPMRCVPSKDALVVEIDGEVAIVAHA